MAVPGELHVLIERFDRELPSYRYGAYNEAQVRVDFLNPLLGLLGWDVENRRGLSETYREVVYEDRVKIGSHTKAPDYGFYTAGKLAGRKLRFFLEAKKPSVDLAGDVNPAVQLRRYAWTAKLPLSILTDFEELAVYDCRFKPNKDDRPSAARLDFFTYDQYVEHWDELAGLFSREAVLGGSLEKYAEENRRKRGTETVDAAFLREIEGWRDLLARNLALRNALNVRQLNYAVQMTIDRIIFLRMAEDRGIEDYGRLMALLNGNDVYGRLRELFREADDRYNSGLFHFRRERDREEEPDGLTLSLNIDDKVLKGIIRGLYYPQSPYEFSVLPVDVLGQVYEQFLGKVIRLSSSGHRAKVEEKPEVRKAGGVYYTPTYIVDYIVEKTVGKLLEGKKPGARGGASKLKIVDPACGSGSFLIGAYQYLLDWHRDRYVEDGPEKHRKVLYKGQGDEWHLTIVEKKRILKNNIYGVDIDPQAVEVTKLSLLLKVLEGESEASLATQLRMFQERSLPDLDDNIKCGNSLIGPDLYDNEQMMLLAEEEHYRINVFDWEKSFPQVFTGDNPGFDAVIGNPPYLAGREWTDFLRMQRPYFKDHFSCMTDQYDLYALFIQRAVELLCLDGLFGVITPTTWLNNEHYTRLRQWLLEKVNIERIGDYRQIEVFANATVLPIVLIASRSRAPSFAKRFSVEAFHSSETTLLTTSAAAWNQFPDLIFNLSMTEADLPVLKSMERVSQPVSSYGDVRFGVKVYQRGKGVPPQTGEEAKERRFESSTKEDDSYYPYIRGKYLTMWQIDADRAWLKYGSHLAEPRYFELFSGPRVLVRRIVGNRLILAPTTDTLIADQLLHTVKPENDNIDYRFLAGLLGSQLISYYFRKRFNRTEKTFPEIRIGELSQLPIRTIDFSDPEEVARHDRMVGLVERMLELHKRLAGARIERERTVIGAQIEATDRQIDRLVYDLYELTEEEIAVVEGESR